MALSIATGLAHLHMEIMGMQGMVACKGKMEINLVKPMYGLMRARWALTLLEVYEFVPFLLLTDDEDYLRLRNVVFIGGLNKNRDIF